MNSSAEAVAPELKLSLGKESSLPGWQLAVLALLTGMLYYPVLGRLVLAWWEDPNFSHGFFVPLFSLLVVWTERKRLADVQLRPSAWGIVIIACSLVLLVMGTLGAELYLTRTSFLFLMAGMIVYFSGWRLFSGLVFPWACLFLMVPIPAILFNEITFPLQLIASQVAASMLNILGVPVLREGNVIRLPVMPLEVAEACSGIRSLVSLGTLAVVYGYLTAGSTVKRVVLVLAAIPIAVFANGLRITGTGLVAQYWDRTKAEGFSTSSRAG